MKEIDFKDRVPTHPGRVKLTPVAGAENTYTMERADEPMVAGTPIDKALFNSIIQSRLTGRYYEPQAQNKTVEGGVTATVNPIPTTWTDISDTQSVSGGYEALASGTSRNHGGRPFRAFDGNTSTEFSSYASSGEEYLTIKLPAALTVYTMSVRCSRTPDNYDKESYKIYGSNNNSTWTLLATATIGKQSAVDVTISQPGSYQYYKITPNTVGNSISVYEWAITSYQTPTYTISYTVPEFPAKWTQGQRATIGMPNNIDTVGVVSDTINGITVNTILQANKRYELRYNGSTFDAKEV